MRRADQDGVDRSGGLERVEVEAVLADRDAHQGPTSARDRTVSGAVAGVLDGDDGSATQQLPQRLGDERQRLRGPRGHEHPVDRRREPAGQAELGDDLCPQVGGAERVRDRVPERGRGRCAPGCPPVPLWDGSDRGDARTAVDERSGRRSGRDAGCVDRAGRAGAGGVRADGRRRTRGPTVQVRRDPREGTVPRPQVPLAVELLVRRDDGAPGHPELRRQRPRRGQRIALAQGAVVHHPAHACHHLGHLARLVHRDRPDLVQAPDHW
ncbi:hypothetical protein WDV91_06940 [Curtobacterium flaccumfaciens pv. flaccumfaciens]